MQQDDPSDITIQQASASLQPNPSVVQPSTQEVHRQSTPLAVAPEHESLSILTTQLSAKANEQPVPVVKVLSVRGVEYFMMSIALWLSAGALVWAILGLINGASDFSIMAIPVSFLVVSLPIFALFYIRLRRAELANPNLRFDPSKRRLSQITQILAFIVCLSNAIAFVYTIMSKISGESTASLLKTFINLLVVCVIAGAILAYYWFDEHRSFNRG